MPDKMTPLQRHECMSHIRSKDTRPELAVRRELWRRGYRYRLNVSRLPGTPDIVLPKYRTVIFVNGCFWHGHDGCPKYTVPKSNVEFWKMKVERNRERDLLNVQWLESIAWAVISVWECELSKSLLSATMVRLETEIKSNKAKWEDYCVRRRQDRSFALEQARRRRAMEALVESELNLQFRIPDRVRRASRESDGNEPDYSEEQHINCNMDNSIVPDWAEGLNCSITVCDGDGVIIYMNDRAVEQYRKRGDLIGRNLFDCHGERSREIIRGLLETGGSNCYTIEKGGVHKLIFQSAWTVEGKVAGLCEISIIIPESMPHYVRG